MKIIDICELRSEELWEGRSSQLYTQLLRVRKKNLKKKIHNFVIIILSRVYNEPIQRPAPSWLVSLIGRALHRYRRGQGFESRLSFRSCIRSSLMY